jgi:hypothetical protein
MKVEDFLEKALRIVVDEHKYDSERLLYVDSKYASERLLYDDDDSYISHQILLGSHRLTIL